MLKELKKTDKGWSAKLGDKPVAILQDQKTRRWTATIGKRKKLEADTFKDVIADLREEARK